MKEAPKISLEVKKIIEINIHKYTTGQSGKEANIQIGEKDLDHFISYN